MKKIFAILLVALMCVSLLAGCGKSEEEKAREEIENALKEEMGDEAWDELQSEMQAGAEHNKEIAEKDKEREELNNQYDTLRKAYYDANKAFFNVDYATISEDELKNIMNNYHEAYINYTSFLEENSRVDANCQTDLTEAEQSLALTVREYASTQDSIIYFIDLETCDYIFVIPENQDDSDLPYIKGYFVTPENDHIDYDFSNEGYTRFYFSVQVPNTVNIEHDLRETVVDLSSGTPVFIDKVDSSNYYKCYENQDIIALSGALL